VSGKINGGNRRCNCSCCGHLRVFTSSRLLGKIFGLRTEVVTGDWRKLRDEEVYDIKDDKMKEDEMGMACSTRGRQACM
jgi:hypothetical protein